MSVSEKETPKLDGEISDIKTIYTSIHHLVYRIQKRHKWGSWSHTWLPPRAMLLHPKWVQVVDSAHIVEDVDHL